MPSGNGRAGGNQRNPEQKRLASGEADLLPPRELEVAELIYAAKTNLQIGLALGCSWHTAKKHVEHILDKLKMDSRVSIGIWWLELQQNGGSSPPGEQKSGRG